VMNNMTRAALLERLGISEDEAALLREAGI
jgi:hypothetical protein